MKISTIDTHMAGSSTRIITDGLPELVGRTMTEKMQYFCANLDDVRRLLILEPRGHQNMWGVVLTEPCDPEADIGAFFVNSEGCFPSCVHSKISLVTAGIQKGFLKAPEQGKPIKIELPVGISNAYPTIVEDKVQSVSIETRASFVEILNIKLLLETGNFINASIVFSGVYFILIDVNQVGFYDQGAELLKSKSGIQKLVSCAINALNQVNKKYELNDPRDSNRVAKVSLAMFYDEIDPQQANDVVISATGSVDRCPCGSAAGAKLALLHHQKRLGMKQDYKLISPIESTLSGKIIGEITNDDGKNAVIPRITGSAFITGEHTFYLDDQDSIRVGFTL